MLVTKRNVCDSYSETSSLEVDFRIKGIVETKSQNQNHSQFEVFLMVITAFNNFQFIRNA